MKKENKKQVRQLENKQEDSRLKPIYIHNYVKCKKSNISLKRQIVRQN